MTKRVACYIQPRVTVVRCSVLGATTPSAAVDTPTMSNDTTSDAIFDHVTVASPVELPVLFAASGSRDSPMRSHGGPGFSTAVAPPDDVVETECLKCTVGGLHQP